MNYYVSNKLKGLPAIMASTFSTNVVGQHFIDMEQLIIQYVNHLKKIFPIYITVFPICHFKNSIHGRIFLFLYAIFCSYVQLLSSSKWVHHLDGCESQQFPEREREKKRGRKEKEI